MRKAIYDKTGMKQIINSGWKEFDNQTNCISTGNVISNTQYSSFIRPFRETECNGRTNPCGHLMNFDLAPFRNYYIPEKIKSILLDKERKDSVILYMFYTTRQYRTVPFCWIVTDRDYNLLSSVVVTGYGESAQKRYSACREAISYIAN